MNNKKIDEVFNKIHDNGVRVINILFLIASFTLFFAIKNVYEFVIVITVIIALFANLLKDFEKYKRLSNILMKISLLLVVIEVGVILTLYFIKRNMIIYIPIAIIALLSIFIFILVRLIKYVKEK